MTSKVYIDPLFFYPLQTTSIPARAVALHNGGRWCHMWTDLGNEEALHQMARKLGLKRAWFQDKHNFPHYDLTPARRALAVMYGCEEKSLKEWIKERNENAPPT